jgi:hypothetical protein
MGIRPPGKCKSFPLSSFPSIVAITLMVVILVVALGFIE